MFGVAVTIFASEIPRSFWLNPHLKKKTHLSRAARPILHSWQCQRWHSWCNLEFRLGIYPARIGIQTTFGDFSYQK